MSTIDDPAHSIDLNLKERLKDREFRRSFFLAEASAKIAEQIINLRKRRKKSQSELANMVGTRQPAISRVERADYQNWSFNTLRSIADALDARIRVFIEPAEDVLCEYQDVPESKNYREEGSAAKAARARLDESNNDGQHLPHPLRSSPKPWNQPSSAGCQ